MDELRKDFEEYQEDSKTLEVELDTQLKQTEQKNKDLTACISRIQNDNENLRVIQVHLFFTWTHTHKQIQIHRSSLNWDKE